MFPYPILCLSRAARGGPSLAQQLATCTSHVEELLLGMGSAIGSVRDLQLTFVHYLVRSNRRKDNRRISSTRNAPQNCPSSFSVIGRAVCSKLAAALPVLQSLRVRGSCRDPAFVAFGASCPSLTHLAVEAITLPIKVLQGLAQHFPLLSSFSLTSPTVCPDNLQLTNYVSLSLRALQACTSLARMTLDFKDGDWVMCKPGCWDHIPASLREFVSRGGLSSLEHAKKLLCQLQILNMKQTFDLGLDILAHAPLLQHYSVYDRPGRAVKLRCDGANEHVSLLKERVLGGLVVQVSFLELSGGASSVQAVLVGLPTLPSVRVVKANFWRGAAPPPLALAHVARVFPNMEELHVKGQSSWPLVPALAMQLLQPLTLCASLVELRVGSIPGLTPVGLAQLCLSIPSLEVLSCSEEDGVDMSELESILTAQGGVTLVQNQYNF